MIWSSRRDMVGIIDRLTEATAVEEVQHAVAEFWELLPALEDNDVVPALDARDHRLLTLAKRLESCGVCGKPHPRPVVIGLHRQ